MPTSSRTALITGASRGIGAAVAQTLAADGFAVALCGRDEAALAAVATKCTQLGARTVVLPVDLAQTSARKKLVDDAVDALGSLQVLVNNAGLLHHAPVQQADLPRWDTLLEVNLHAVVHLTHHALPHLLRASGAAVINIASISGKQTHAGGAIYCASKHALVGFSNCLFEDVRAHNVKVCAICPGFVATEMIAGRGVDVDRAIAAQDVADTVRYVVHSGVRVCPTEIILRPQQPMD